MPAGTPDGGHQLAGREQRVKLSYDDEKHVYRLNGVPCKSVTKVAEIINSTWNLERWKERQILIGLAKKPQLADNMAAYISDKKALDSIVRKAMDAAGSDDAADRGSAIHRIVELVDRGEPIPDKWQPWAAAWQKALHDAGLEIVPELIERIVVYPGSRVAGRADRFCRRTIDGRLVVVDLKTGEHAVEYPHSTAVQLALYANAPLMAAPLPTEGGITEDLNPLPPIDTSIGYIVHMPSEDRIDIVGVDLVEGWKAADLCFKALEWQRKKDLTFPVLERECEVISREQWVQNRVDRIIELGPVGKQKLRGCWPLGINKRPPWTDFEIDRIIRSLDLAEADLQLPFGEPDPGTAA